MQELNFEEIGQAIRASRIEQHYTQEYVAEQVGVSDSIDREILKELAACSPEKKEKILKIIRII